MQLEQQLCSLELSKKLQELGTKQESLFYWVRMPTKDANIDGYALSMITDLFGANSDYEKLHSAFTVGELLAMLPYHIVTKEPEPFNSYRLYISGSVIIKNTECIIPTRVHFVNYKGDTYDMNNPITLDKNLTKTIWDENPANALAKMLIFLIENKLFTFS